MVHDIVHHPYSITQCAMGHGIVHHKCSMVHRVHCPYGIVHPVHDAIWVVQDVLHHCELGAQYYIRGA